MKLWKKTVAVVAACALGAFGLAGCSSSDNNSSASGEATTDESAVIKVGASPSPHAEILNAISEDLTKAGYTLEVVEYNDYILPNTAVDEGELDANFFQHITYLNDFNEKNGTDLVSVADVHYEPLGVYSETLKSLADVEQGATIAVPNDPTNEARALLLLQDQGLIKLKDGVTLNATQVDIVENPKNIQFKEIEAAQAVLALPDVAAAVINGNYAMKAGLDIADAIAVEEPSDELIQAYKNVLVVKAGNESDPKIQALVEAINSDTVKQYIEDTYAGNGQSAVIVAF